MDRDLQREALNETRQRIAALEALLEELPGLFEARFRERLQPLLEQQQRLQDNNAILQQRLLQQRGAGEPRRLLRLLLRPQVDRLNPGADGQPRAVSAGPTHR